MNEKNQIPESGELPLTETAIEIELIESNKVYNDFVVGMAGTEKDREAINKEWAEFDKELSEINQALAWHEESKAQTEVLLTEIAQDLL